MKLKRSISLLLLAVYLFATAGTALASLTCKCVAMKARTEHACCSHCHHVADLPAAAGGEMRAPCCGKHHSTEIELYVSSSSDSNERYTRCIVLDLPPALAAECACSFSARKGRREADAFRPGSLHTLRRLPRPSRIGLRLLRDRCRVRRSAISFNQ
jgi:hypothetical protein